MANGNEGGEALTTEQVEAIIKERDEAKAALGNTVEEIKSMRKTKQELEAAKAEVERKLAEASRSSSEAPKPEDFERIVDQKLNEKLSLKEKEEATREEEQAWKEFVSKHPEFDSETDKTGLRMETLKRELSRFNLSGAKKKDDYLNVMKDAVTLLYRKENKEYTSPYASSPSNGGGSQVVQDGSSLSPEEKATMQRLGWTVQKFNDMKMKHPDLYGSVFNK